MNYKIIINIYNIFHMSVFKISLSLFIFIILLTNISISYTINHHDKWYIHSKTEIKYYDNNEQLVTIPVCLRTLKSKLNIREVGEEDRWGGTMYGTLIYESKIWELVLSPNTLDESIIYLDNLYLVEGELHNGKLYNTSLKYSETEERLFIYFFQYGTSSNEMIIIFYFDVNIYKLEPIKFKDYKGNITYDIDIIGKSLDNYEINTADEAVCKRYKIKKPEYSICTKYFYVGNPNTLTTSIWKFDYDNLSFVEILRIVRNQENDRVIRILK